MELTAVAVSQSATHGGYDKASQARDGNIKSYTRTNQQVNPWWQLDLGRSKQISKIQIYNRHSGKTNRLNKFDILIGNDPKGESFSKCKQEQDMTDVMERMFDCDGGDMIGRYIRVVQRGYNQILTLGEFIVYGRELQS